MRKLFKYLIRLIAFAIFFLFFYHYLPPDDPSPSKLIAPPSDDLKELTSRNESMHSLPIIYLWCIAVKIEGTNSALMRKFKIFIQSLLHHSECKISLNILTDGKSKVFLNQLLANSVNASRNKLDEITFHDIYAASKKIKPITEVMQLHFSSVPGTYYSDSLFYVSLGLHEIAPKHHDKVILVDVDIRFETSVASLYHLFSEFKTETLFGLAPELTPVYRHILWKWRQMNPYSSFGEPSYRGYSGLNSGVVLLKLDAIRQSEKYRSCTTQRYIDEITSKYFFKGHLGDQDFYTLLGMEEPHLIKILPCTWNRQLCQWWKDHGYAEIFDEFARCDGHVNIYHGNCNTPIPTSSR